MRKIYTIIFIAFLAMVVLGLRLMLLNESGLVFLEDVETYWTFHTYIGLTIFIFFAAIAINPYLRKIAPIKKFQSNLTSKHKIPHEIKWWTMIALAVMAAYTFTYCNYICSTFNLTTFEPELPFFHILFRYSLSFFPYLIAACIIGGFITKYFIGGKYKMPDSLLGSIAFASAMPICSCGAIPIAKAMLNTKQVRVRTVIAFLMVAPVITPVVVPMSFQLGAPYAISRIVGIIILAIVTGIVVERFAGVKEEGKGGKSYSCTGCTSQTHFEQASIKSGFIASWDLLLSLLRPITIGILFGTAIAKWVPPELIASLLRPDAIGLIIAAAIGLPIYMCHGQDIAILKPLMNVQLMGVYTLPVGHALAFSIAGSGICASAIPPLIATIGKRATSIVVAAFFIGCILIGLVVNFLLSLPFFAGL